MSVQAISHVIENSKQNGNPFMVLLMIANHAKSDGTGAWPSIPTLARESRISERTVQRCITRLVKEGELRVHQNAGPHGCHLYDVRGVKLTPGGVKVSREGCQALSPKGCQALSPEPSLTVNKDKESHSQLILWAVEESERTGRPADDILKEIRKQPTGENQ